MSIEDEPLRIAFLNHISNDELERMIEVERVQRMMETAQRAYIMANEQGYAMYNLETGEVHGPSDMTITGDSSEMIILDDFHDIEDRAHKRIHSDLKVLMFRPNHVWNHEMLTVDCQGGYDFEESRQVHEQRPIKPMKSARRQSFRQSMRSVNRNR